MKKSAVRNASIVAIMVGALVLTIGCSKSKEVDKVITMNDLPAAVKPLAEKEVSGYKIIEVEQEMKDGKLIYTIAYDSAGTEMELEYSPEGALISKGKE
ncbi:MAG: hypothetical protein WC703_07130 [Candidatus Neomarinimicrobiota bacterium]